jgi:uncharacterized protein
VRGDEALTPWYEALVEVLPELHPFDAHTHLGAHDPDGFRLDAERLVTGLDRVDGRAVVFPMSEPGGDYATANDDVIADAARARGRLLPFCRLNPHRDPVAEASRCVEAGARGIKLHPRAEYFGLDLPAVHDVFAYAAQQRLPILVHAGGGIPSLAAPVLRLAADFPEVPVILAHAAISDLTALWRRVPEVPNLLFDTSWWNATDLLALFALVPPGRILYASDSPYETPLQNAVLTLRCALQAGVAAECLPSVMGAQLERLLSGEPARDLGAAPGVGRLGTSIHLQRIHANLLCAVAQMRIGHGGQEGLTLARRACEGAEGAAEEPVLRSVLALLDIHRDYVAGDPDEPGVAHAPGYPLVAAAAAVAATPDAPVPPHSRG